MLMCEYCQGEVKRNGYKLIVGDMAYSFEEAMEENIPCEICDEYDDLYEVTAEEVDKYED